MRSKHAEYDKYIIIIITNALLKIV